MYTRPKQRTTITDFRKLTQQLKVVLSCCVTKEVCDGCLLLRVTGDDILSFTDKLLRFVSLETDIVTETQRKTVQ